jgi:hypothetical protein
MINKIRYWIATFKIAKIANDIIKNNKIDIIHGYEYHGVLAIKLLKMLGKLVKNLITKTQFIIGGDGPKLDEYKNFAKN